MDALAARLARLVAHPTVAAPDPAATDPTPFEALHRTLAELYPLLHERCELTRVGPHGLLFLWPGSDPDADALVLMAHQDVVPVTGQDWSGDPFEARVVDGKLIGRGVLDDKGMLLVIAEAVEALLAAGFAPRRDVWLLFGDNEEVAGTTAQEAAELLRGRGVRPWLVLDEGGAVVDAGVLPGVGRSAAMVAVADPPSGRSN